MMSWRRSYSGGGAPQGLQGLQDTRGSKGLINQPGQNNCFLNSALQVLWHLDIFRRSFCQISSHQCSGESCVFCALKSIFSELQYSSRSVLPSDPLRSALANTFSSQQRFQLGGMDDAAECFENILMRIHFHTSEETSQDISTSSPCTSSLCIPHQKFSMMLYEQCVCNSCGASSDPLPFIQMIHYISTTSLCNQAVEMLQSRSDASPAMFGELLRNASSVGDLRNCPASCGAQQRIFRVLLNSPEVVTIGLVWDSATSDLTGDLIHALGTRLRLGDLFGGVEQAKARRAELFLVGVVCYYGRHYSSFFYHTRARRWMYCDDEKVTEVGPRWRDVVWRCIKGRYQPLLLLYADPRGTPVVLHHTPPPPSPPDSARPHLNTCYDSEDSGRELSISSDTRTDSSTDSCSRPQSSQTHTGETLKECQAPCPPPRSSSSRRLRDFKETMNSIIHSRPLSSSSSSSLPSSFSTGPAPIMRDWETDSSSSESQACGSGGRSSRPVWRPRREVLNIDSIFTRERRRQAGYSPLGGPLLEDQNPGTNPGPNLNPDLYPGPNLNPNLYPNPCPNLNPNPNPGPNLNPISGPNLNPNTGPNLRPNLYPISGPGHNRPKQTPSTLTLQGGGIQRTESGYESSERNTSPVDRNSCPLSILTPCRPSGRSELDELQEEVWRQAREVEQQREREREREAAMGFNPTPSKILDLDQLQIQGTGVRAERCVSEVELHLDQSVRLEKAGEVAAALSVVNEAVLKLTSLAPTQPPSIHRRKPLSQARLRGCLQRAHSLQARLLLQQAAHTLPPEPQLLHREELQQEIKHQKPQQRQTLQHEVGATLSQEHVDFNKNHQYHHGYGQQPDHQLLSAGFLEEAEPQLPLSASTKPVLLQVLLTDRQDDQTPPPDDSPISLALPDSPREGSRRAAGPPPSPPPGIAPPTGHTHYITDRHRRTKAPPPYSSAPPPAAMATMPVEHWLHDISRYYDSQNALHGLPNQMSELDALYQASLQAPSMHRGSSTTGPSTASQSKTPTAEMEKFTYRTPDPTLELQEGFHDDENYSAENLRRVTRSLSARVTGSRPLNCSPDRPNHYCSSPPPPVPPTEHSGQTERSSLEQRYRSVALSYGTLPRAPPSSISPKWFRGAPSQTPPSSPGGWRYATLPSPGITSSHHSSASSPAPRQPQRVGVRPLRQVPLRPQGPPRPPALRPLSRTPAPYSPPLTQAAP